MAQWLRIHLPMQGTQVRSLVREDPTCRQATNPVRHNYWACALEPVEARTPQLLKPARLEAMLCNERSHCNEKPVHRNQRKPTRSNEDPVQPKKKKKKTLQGRGRHKHFNHYIEIRKCKYREVISLAQGHTTHQWEKLGSDSRVCALSYCITERNVHSITPFFICKALTNEHMLIHMLSIDKQRLWKETHLGICIGYFRK